MREIRTLRATWRGLETWNGRITTAAGAPVLDPTCLLSTLSILLGVFGRGSAGTHPAGGPIRGDGGSSHLGARRINPIYQIRIISAAAYVHMHVKPDVLPDDGWRIPMTYIIRAAFLALSLATIPPVANAAQVDHAPAPIQQDWANG
jgi:hypothetical protein